jgi:hypothetical protein
MELAATPKTRSHSADDADHGDATSCAMNKIISVDKEATAGTSRRQPVDVHR